jgi:hypothetical protein
MLQNPAHPESPKACPLGEIRGSILAGVDFSPIFDDFVVISFRWKAIPTDLNADSESAQETASA